MTANSTIFFTALLPLLAGLVGVAVLLRHSRRPPQTLRSGILGTSLHDLRRQRTRFIRDLHHERSYSPALLAAEFGPSVLATGERSADVATDVAALRDAA